MRVILAEFRSSILENDILIDRFDDPTMRDTHANRSFPVFGDRVSVRVALQRRSSGYRDIQLRRNTRYADRKNQVHLSLPNVQALLDAYCCEFWFRHYSLVFIHDTMEHRLSESIGEVRHIVKDR